MVSVAALVLSGVLATVDIAAGLSAAAACDGLTYRNNTGVAVKPGTKATQYHNAGGLQGCCDACARAGPQGCEAFFTGPAFELCVLYPAGSVLGTTRSQGGHSSGFRGPAPPPAPPQPPSKPGGGLDQELVVLSTEEAAPFGARCLDGSPPAIYYSPARGEDNQDNWVIYFKGGGWCFDEASCAQRSKGSLGGSTHLPRFLNQTWDKSSGPLHPNTTLNPTFANYHRVLLWYCDGGSFAGAVDHPVDVNGTQLFFRGRAILLAQMAKLRASYGLTTAKNVLLTGCSAGGYATYAHADFVRTLIHSPALGRYKVAGLSGFFLDHKNVSGSPHIRELFDSMYSMQNMSSGVSSACVRATGGRCSFPQENYAYVDAPFFVMNSMLDAFHMAEILQVGCTFPSCNPSQISDIQQYQRDFHTAIAGYGTFSKRGNGAFLDNCVLHCGEQDYPGFNGIALRPAGGSSATVMQQALTAWWESEGEPASAHTYVETCTVTAAGHCNPTCPGGTALR